MLCGYLSEDSFLEWFIDFRSTLCGLKVAPFSNNS